MADVIPIPMYCVELENDKLSGAIVYNKRSGRIILVEGDIPDQFMYRNIATILRGLLTIGWKVTREGQFIP